MDEQSHQIDDDAELDAILRHCALSRTWFAEHILGFYPDPWQKQVFEDLDTGGTRLSIRSGHGVGKTAACAVIALHFLLFRPGSTKVVITSPSSSQLFDGLWSELLLWIDRLPDFLRETLDVKTKRIVDIEAPETRFISLRTARLESPEALAGIHADNVLLLIDEASGVPEPVYEAGAGTLSTLGSIAMLIGNPTRTSGYFYRTQTTLKDHWSCYRVSSYDSPRVSKAFVEDIRRTYGEASAQYKIRVLGEFADLNEDVIIPRELVESALGRDIVPLDDEPVVWGIDPGRGGDPTGFVARRGGVVIDIRQYFLADLMQVVGKIYSIWEDLTERTRPKHVYVDVIGIGAGVADRLRELGLPVIDVNVAESPPIKDRYPRRRDELWYNSRDWFDSRGVSLPNTDYGRELVEELCAPLIVLTSTGKTAAESKIDMKRRGVASPNMADALNLTFAWGGAAAGGRTKAANRNGPLKRGLQGVA